jgi:hypothetical protein
MIIIISYAIIVIGKSLVPEIVKVILNIYGTNSLARL